MSVLMKKFWKSLTVW